MENSEKICQHRNGLLNSMNESVHFATVDNNIVENQKFELYIQEHFVFECTDCDKRFNSNTLNPVPDWFKKLISDYYEISGD